MRRYANALGKLVEIAELVYDPLRTELVYPVVVDPPADYPEPEDHA